MKSLNLAATALTLSFVAGAAMAETGVKVDNTVSDKQAHIATEVSTTSVSSTTHSGEHGSHKADHKAKKEAK